MRAHCPHAAPAFVAHLVGFNVWRGVGWEVGVLSRGGPHRRPDSPVPFTRTSSASPAPSRPHHFISSAIPRYRNRKNDAVLRANYQVQIFLFSSITNPGLVSDPGRLSVVLSLIQTCRGSAGVLGVQESPDQTDSRRLLPRQSMIRRRPEAAEENEEEVGGQQEQHEEERGPEEEEEEHEEEEEGEEQALWFPPVFFLSIS